MDQSKDNKEKEFYCKEIIKMVEGIKNLGTLKYLNTFIKLFLKIWG